MGEIELSGREERRGGVLERRVAQRGGCDPILQNGARHNLFIWCPSESPFPRSHCSTDLPSSLAPLLVCRSPICLTFPRHNIPSFFKDCIVHQRQCSFDSYMFLLTLLLLSASSNLKKLRVERQGANGPCAWLGSLQDVMDGNVNI